MRIFAALLMFLAAECALDVGPPARTVERFAAATAAQQGEAACALLTPKAAQKLPDQGQTCALALEELGLRVGAVESVAVWGDEAQVRLNGDTMFLQRFEEGWRIRAAGCTPTGEDQPYDCEVEDCCARSSS
ncbi:hypothetical protein [Nonomuraea recticatena]|uniref:Uncharacterized protein n=1 Tax=Nonomuraea recticatena TaxID=46178 RepID=A0ABN3TGJ9_9ACTN